jgi:hypothetical protein
LSYFVGGILEQSSMALKDRWNRLDDGQKAVAALGLAGLAALVIWIVGGLLTLSFASCDVGTCSDGSCWWGCDCGYFASDSPAYGAAVAWHGLRAQAAP